MIPDLKQITTRKGDRMAIVQLEDLSGGCEAIVFPKTYIRLSEFLLTDTRLLVWGTIDKKSDKTQLIIDDCSTDDTKLLCNDYNLDFIEKKGPMGLTHSWNLGYINFKKKADSMALN